MKAALLALLALPLYAQQDPAPGYPAIACTIVQGVGQLYSLRPVAGPRGAISCDLGMLVFPQVTACVVDGSAATQPPACAGLPLLFGVVQFVCSGLGNLPTNPACPGNVSLPAAPTYAYGGALYFGFSALGGFVVGVGPTVAMNSASCASLCALTGQSGPAPGDYAIATVPVYAGSDGVPIFQKPVQQLWNGYPAQPLPPAVVIDSRCTPQAGAQLVLSVGVFVVADGQTVKVDCQ